eukprot:gene25879-11551_t
MNASMKQSVNMSRTSKVTAPRSTLAQRSSRFAAIVPKAAEIVAPRAAPEMRELGNSGLQVPCVGVGAWSWGDKSGYWGYGTEYGKEESRSAYKAIMEYGLSFIDTAEVYGFGKSEEFLGEFIKEGGEVPLVATKYAPQPWRQQASCVPEALRASLTRLQQDKVALYIQHWPGFALNAFSNESTLEGLILCKQQGLADAIGVSNFNADRVRGAVRRLGDAGCVLSSNQVQYSLLYREPERNGVMEACLEAGVTPVAYSPLCQGLLTGKYKVGGERPFGPRKFLFSDKRINEIAPVLSALEAIAEERGKTMAQVAINWTVCKGALPIPGAKTEKQLKEIAGSVGWRLSEGEVTELDNASGKVPSATGAPFEKW